MAKKIGILVKSNNHFNKLLKFCKAAQKKEVEVELFLTHNGTLITQNPEFLKLTKHTKISLCRVSFENNNLTRPIEGIDEKAYVTQARHADIIQDSDRYLVF